MVHFQYLRKFKVLIWKEMNFPDRNSRWLANLGTFIYYVSKFREGGGFENMSLYDQRERGVHECITSNIIV